MAGQRGLRGNVSSCVACEAGRENRCAVGERRPRIKRPGAVKEWERNGSRDCASLNVVEERVGVEFPAMPLRELVSLDAGVETAGNHRVDDRALQGPQRQLCDDFACASFDYLRNCCANDLRYGELGGGDSGSTFSGCEPVDSYGGGQEGEGAGQDGQVGDVHLFGEFDFGASLVDGIAEVTKLLDDDINGAIAGHERLEFGLHGVVSLAFCEAGQRVSGCGLYRGLLRFKLVGEVLPSPSLLPGFVFVPVWEVLANEIADPTQPTGDLNAHGRRPGSQTRRAST